MTLHLTAVAAKDGAGTTIPGGVNQHDTSGGGTGPNDPVIVIVDSTGAEVIGTKADAAATQTDTTAVSGISLWKQISKTLQAAAGAVATAFFAKITDGTNTAAVKAASTAPLTTDTSLVIGSADGNIVTLGAKADAANIATDTTAVSHTSLLKQISKTLQAMVSAATTALFAKITDGTNNLALLAASSGSPAATVVAVPVSVRDANPNIVALSGGTVAAGTAGAPVVGADQYSTHKEVGASQTAAVLGATGAIGDYLSHVTVFPGVAACGAVTILDSAGTVGTFAGGGTTALPDLRPFMIPIGAFCTGAGWKITTGGNVTVTAVGKFT